MNKKQSENISEKFDFVTCLKLVVKVNKIGITKFCMF